MTKRLAFVLFMSAAMLAGCGGGGSSSPANPGPPPPTNPPPSGNLPLSESVGASPAWVQPSSHRTLYFLDSESATTQLCTTGSGCVNLWPIFAPVAGSTGTDNMTIITRSDGAGQQWAYQGHPLYTYTGDTGADQANGEGVPDFGGHWHVARPAAAGTATPPPGDVGGCHGYC